jgi:membrane associated rhomboid family serine protease
VLRAKGIAFRHVRDDHGHGLYVEAEAAETALAELAVYEEENRSFRPRTPLPPAMEGAAPSTAVALLLLVAFWLADVERALGLDWRGAGIAHASALRSGELWRAFTALTLHDGLLHLASNLLWLGFFGFLGALGHGPGLAWLAIVVAGALGNAANALIQDPTHLSLGASTSVFAAIGLLGGSEWRRRFLLRQRRLLVWAPIVVALWLLGWFGLGSQEGERALERVDVLAHVLGLAAGLGLGTLLPALAARGARARHFQALCGLLAALLVAGAWAAAFAFRASW